MSAVVDLHLHSHHSDGVLTPAELVALASERGVSGLALTDHDSVAGCAAARAACLAHSIGFVNGAELSASWRGQAVHVIGLGLDEQSDVFIAHLADLIARRRVRIGTIGERLARRARIPGIELAEQVLADAAVPTRMHLARRLVERGLSSDTQDAFDRWLGRNAPGHTPIAWPALEVTLAALHAAGAQIVLAHPHRYRLSGGALRSLIGEFHALGGHGIEVSIGGISRNDGDRLATLARGHRLAASSGSDFHDPAIPWHLPGRFAKLPSDLEPIASRLAF